MKVKKDDVMYVLLCVSFILNVLFLWSHFKMMALATAQEPTCSIERAFEEVPENGTAVCGDYLVLKKNNKIIARRKP